MLLLGYDIGSSSIKAAIIEVTTGKLLASASSPETELPILAPQKGWAEQNPEDWWKHVKLVTIKLKSKYKIDLKKVGAIGISYQMHGLVLIDKKGRVLRPAIIWCDSRAVEIGQKAFNDLTPNYCLTNYLNSPGNFTAAKLKWVMLNEPAIYRKVFKFMLPGDYLAFKLFVP